MNPTEEIKSKLNLATMKELSDARYESFNTGGVECLVGEFLYSLVRMLKPKRILETGTHFGISSSYMGLALKENKEGHIDTLEWDPNNIEVSKQKWQALGIGSFITPYKTDSLQFKAKEAYDLLFLDTEPYLRFSELNRYWPNLKEGGHILIHDLHWHLGINQPPWENFVEKIGDKIKNYELQIIGFATPRCLILMQKYHEDMGAYRLLQGKEK